MKNFRFPLAALFALFAITATFATEFTIDMGRVRTVQGSYADTIQVVSGVIKQWNGSAYVPDSTARDTLALRSASTPGGISAGIYPHDGKAVLLFTQATTATDSLGLVFNLNWVFDSAIVNFGRLADSSHMSVITTFSPVNDTGSSAVYLTFPQGATRVVLTPHTSAKTCRTCTITLALKRVLAL